MPQRSSKYWEERFEILNDSLLKKADDELIRLEEEYAKSFIRLEKEIGRWYSRFAENNGVTMQGAKKLLKADELKEFHWTLEEYIKYGKENVINQQWVKELENASAKVHITELKEMQIHLRQQIEVLSFERENGLAKTAYEIYENGYYQSIYEIQKEVPVSDFNQLKEKNVKDILKKPWNGGKSFSQKIWEDREVLAEKLETGLVQAIIRGDSKDKLIKSIAKQFHVSQTAAGRLVMTESAYFASLGQLDSYKELGIKKYKIVATLDRKTSNICQHMDGMILEVKYFRPGVSAPPFHPWCRSCTCPYIDNMDKNAQRMARDDNGKNYYVPASMSYSEWRKEYVDKGDSVTINEPVADSDKIKTFNLEKIDFADKIMVLSTIRKYEEEIVNSSVENAVVIMKDGTMQKYIGTLNGVDLDVDSSKLDGAIVTHNHPIGSVNEYSFSEQDIRLFMNNNLSILRGIDEKYIYELTRNSDEIDTHAFIFELDEYSARHEDVISKAERLGIGYRRYLRE